MKISDIVHWVGVSLCFIAVGGVAVIGLRNSSFFGTRKSPLSELSPLDIKIAKYSGLFLLFGFLVLAIEFFLF